MRRFLIAFVILFGTIPQSFGQDAALLVVGEAVAYEDPDAYAIYSFLLASQKEKAFVIQSELQYVPELQRSGIEGGADFNKVWAGAVEHYVRGFHQKLSLQQNFSLDVPYQLLSKAEIKLAFKLPPERKPELGEGWAQFYSKYPGARGYYYFSAVGFDKTRSHAIVHMDNWCGILCGGGYPHFFEKTDGNWHEATVKASIRGWAS